MTRRILQSGRMPRFSVEEVVLAEFLEDMRPLLSGVLGPKTRLRMMVASEPERWSLDRYVVEHALLNLCANSRDAISGQGEVVVQVEAAEDRGHPALKLSVGDNGEGMDEETLRRCREPFFTTKDASQGTGLGLAGVVEAVRKHGGELSIDSTPGLGTRVEMLFPDRQESSRPARRREWPDPDEMGVVLVVDDDPAARELAARRLELYGYRALPAASIAEALSVAEAAGPLELAVLDLELGEEDGRRLATLLRDIEPELPVVLCSGNQDALAAVNGERDAIACLPKPYVPEEFSAAVLAAISRIQRRFAQVRPQGGRNGSGS